MSDRQVAITRNVGPAVVEVRHGKNKNDLEVMIRVGYGDGGSGTIYVSYDLFDQIALAASRSMRELREMPS